MVRSLEKLARFLQIMFAAFGGMVTGCAMATMDWGFWTIALIVTCALGVVVARMAEKEEQRRKKR